MATVENKSNKKSIWAKIGGVAKTGGKVAGEVLLLVPKALIYPARKPLAKTAEVKHDAMVSLKEAVGIEVPEEEKEFNSPIEMNLSSESLDVQITGCKKGKVTFLAPRSLVGDIAHFTQKELAKVEEFNKNSKYSSISIDREQNNVSIEIDVEGIIKKLKRDIDAQELEVSEAQIKELILQGIAEEIHLSIAAVMEVGGRSVTKDRKIANGIAGKLYQRYDDHKKELKKASEVVTPLEGPVQSSDPSDTLRPVSNGQRSSETLTPKIDGKPSEAFRRIVQEAAEPLVNSCKRTLESSGIDDQSHKKRKIEPQGSQEFNR